MGDEKQSTEPASKVTEDVVAEVVQETGAVEKSVLRRIVGLPVRGAVGKAVDAALVERGIAPGEGSVTFTMRDPRHL